MFAVLGILLLIAGAMLAFAVERQAEGVDLEVIGWILMAGGTVSLLVASLQGASTLSGRRGSTRTERRTVSDGHGVVDSEPAR